MLLVGIITRRNELSAPDMRWGITQLTSIPVIVLFYVAVGIYAGAGTKRDSILYAAIAVAGAVFLVRHLILPRWLRRAIPDPSN
jgi:hypothetical protein